MKSHFLQQKECSNQKIEENKSDLEFNFLLKSKCASLNFEIWVFGANLTEPYCPKRAGRRNSRVVSGSTRLLLLLLLLAPLALPTSFLTYRFFATRLWLPHGMHMAHGHDFSEVKGERKISKTDLCV